MEIKKILIGIGLLCAAQNMSAFNAERFVRNNPKKVALGVATVAAGLGTVLLKKYAPTKYETAKNTVSSVATGTKKVAGKLVWPLAFLTATAMVCGTALLIK